jgi:hypothetical protein
MAFVRRSFVDLAERVWLDARSNFLDSDVLMPMLLGITAKGRMLSVAQVTDDPTPEDTRLIEELMRRGVFIASGDWRDNVSGLTAWAHDNQVVAGILVGETYQAVGAEAAVAYTKGVMPRENPNSTEAIFMMAAWPREFVSIGRTAQIHRNDDGSTWLDDPFTGEFSGWLNDVLPGVHGRKSSAAR